MTPTARVYWPFLVGSGVLAVLLALWFKVDIRSLASGSIWLHRSARLDYKLWLVKQLAKVAGLLVLPWTTLVIARWTLRGLVAQVGFIETLDLPAPLVCALFSVSLFVAWDFSRYLLHRLMHRIPALWSLHQVHHSAEVLTPMTFYRTHPIESLLYQLRGVLVAGVMTGVFFWLFGGRAVTWQLVGVDALGFALNLFGGNLRHSHVWLSYGWLERWLISPAQHQLHHAQGCQQNYGAWLATWDRLAGTWVPAGQARSLQFGVADSERNHRPDSLVSVLWRPVVEAMTLCLPDRSSTSGRALISTATRMALCLATVVLC